MTRSILVGEVRTGRRITQIPVRDASWSIVHRGPGDITVDIPLDADDFRVLERRWEASRFFGGPGEVVSPTTYTSPATPVWRPGDGMRPELLAALEPVRCFLAVVEDDVVLEAGPIWAWDYTYGGDLTVKAAGLWSLFDHRYVMGVLTSGFASWSATYDGLSLATIAKRLVQLLAQHTGGSLPIVLPADEAGPHTRTYRGHELATARDRIEQLMGVIGGPDIAFRPRLTADRLGVEWVMMAGTVADPLLHQPGEDHVWDSRVPQSPIGGLSVARDAGGVAGRAWVTGAGQDEALMMARAESSTLVGAGFPLVESSQSRATVERQDTLDQWAAGDLRAAARPWQSWSADVSAHPAATVGDQAIPAGPQLGSYWPGDWSRLWVPRSHPLLGMLLPEGYHRARIMRVSGGMGDRVRVEWAPSMEAR